MTTRQIVKKLEEQGHSIHYYVRKDGGILIKRIDGEVFTSGAKGNIRARQMLGVEISQARSAQLKYATTTRQRKKIPLDDLLEQEYNRVKKIWSKHIKPKEGKPHHAGYFGKGRIEYTLKTEGKEEALRRIKEAERYALGTAYSKNVSLLAKFIRIAGTNYRSKALLKLADDIEANSWSIKEDWIVPAYDALYKLDQGVPPAEVARNTRAILRLL